MDLGPAELMIILVIVVILFGGGRVAKIGGELGSAVANFRRGLEEGSKQKPANPPQDTPTSSESPS